jgi:hypothetical protein
MKIKRSFARKLNMSLYGGKAYETADFLCEAEDEADDTQKEIVSEKLNKFCKDEVLKAMNEYVKDIKK